MQSLYKITRLNSQLIQRNLGKVSRGRYTLGGNPLLPVSSTSHLLSRSYVIKTIEAKDHERKASVMFQRYSEMLLAKGFEQFEKRNTEKGLPNRSGGNFQEDSSKQGGDSGSGSGSGGGSGKGKGGGKKSNKDSGPSQEMIIAGAVVAALTLAFLFSRSMMREHEISWQEFETKYLEAGRVEKLIVHDRSRVQVISKPAIVENDVHFSDNNTTFSHQPTNDSGFQFQSPSQFLSQLSSSSHSHDSTSHHSQSPNPSEPLHGVLPRPEYFMIGSVDSFERKLDDAFKRLNIPPKDQFPVIYAQDAHIDMNTVISVILLLMIGGSMWATRNMAGGGGGPGGIFGFGRSTAKVVKPEEVNVKFNDVAGCDEAKREIMEFVEFLKAPKRFEQLGAKIPKGALLHGPPGTGKTLLAKATAGEAGVPFYSISGSDFVEMFVGVGASRVRDLFKEARANAPCIIFIDEIDAVGRARNKSGMGGHDERENTLNQLLVEMDGFDSTANIVILAGTNRADMLDKALTRPGRFDRTITMELPDIKGREKVFGIHLKKLKLHGTIDEFSPRLAALTPGFSGADIANVCNEAAIVAGRQNKTSIDMSDFEKATDRIIGGLESSKIISAEEKKTVAYHEAGHAIAGWFLEHADPLLKVTIIPRGKGSLGYAQYLPKEVFLRTKDQIMDIICMALAGRASEQVFFGKYTTGASDDLRKVTNIVYQMIQVYGMNERIGQLAFPKDENQPYGQERVYSEKTAEIMDQEAQELVDVAFKRTLALIEKHQNDVRLVAEKLLQMETISHNDIAELVGPRPYSAGKEYDHFVQMSKKTKEEAAASAEQAQQSSSSEQEQQLSDEKDKAVNNFVNGTPLY